MDRVRGAVVRQGTSPGSHRDPMDVGPHELSRTFRSGSREPGYVAIAPDLYPGSGIVPRIQRIRQAHAAPFNRPTLWKDLLATVSLSQDS